ncbi:ABC transporter ATP-binding protein [Kribbella italica]|uniref:ATP-binding cassette subfamily B protein n=1 Tax=Kribbella italica TaxID=1540520 RepID=A0A7W9MTD6_9ACTN|nr:ABC transporter ATP-binding protein [Kribbella italica]MBB5835681.1 ATP-binding cassette subfamily B protein [Kribbella italica]
MDHDNSERGRRGGPKSATAAEKAQAREVSLARIGRLFTAHKLSLAVVTAIIVASSVVAMASPFLLRAVIDTALPRQDLNLLVWLVIGMVAVAAVTSALGVVQTWISTTVGQQVMHRLRTDVFAHLQRQSIAFFTRTRTGEVQSRITNDIGGMEPVVTSTATSIASNLTTAIATAVAMLALSWQLSLISLVVMPPAIYLTRKVARMRRAITVQRQRELADLNVTVEEGLSISGIQLSKTMGTASTLVERFTDSSARLIDLELRSELAGRWRMASMSVIFAAIPAIIYLSAGLPGTAGTLSIGTLIAFTTLQAGLFRPLMGLLNVGIALTTSLALFARIFEYLDLPIDVDDPADPVEIDPARLEGHVRFEDVTFAYPGSETAAVAGVSLDVPAGTTLALVGETGSGKSTLASLVARLYDPTSGRVTIDGIDLRDLRLADLAGVVGVVSQETYLLHTTVRENLRYAKPDATDAEIEDAARAAQVHELIAALPDGYDTMVGSRGHRFSGGEKQRIAIARTLLRNPRVLVLDEATSALDTETERAVQQAFDRLSEGRTTITIAHRLSTVRDADQLVVIDHGRVIESGTHATLVESNGRYARLAT